MLCNVMTLVYMTKESVRGTTHGIFPHMTKATSYGIVTIIF